MQLAGEIGDLDRFYRAVDEVQERTLFHGIPASNAPMNRFEAYLHNEGKVPPPRKSIGYAHDPVRPRVKGSIGPSGGAGSRKVTTDLTRSHAEHVIYALDTDAFRQDNGQRFSEASKGKITDALKNWLVPLAALRSSSRVM